jgi:hypothetical protein
MAKEGTGWEGNSLHPSRKILAMPVVEAQSEHFSPVALLTCRLNIRPLLIHRSFLKKKIESLMFKSIFFV